ncbi:MAG: sigma 54-interacting transcriptional regulator [Pseudomonadota bacterium]
MNIAFEPSRPFSPRPCAFRGLVANSVPARRLFSQAAALAASDVTLLLLGEPGTGKRSLAAAIHAESPQCGGPLVTLPTLEVFAGLGPNPVALDEEALRERAGVLGLDECAGGTLVLTGFGDLRLVEQIALQRLLRRMARASAGSPRFRVILTADVSLEEALRAGQLRRDVYHRVEIVPLFVPALRDRPGDLALIAGLALARAGRDPIRAGFDRAAVALMEAYPFPGNVRELDSVVAEAAAQAPPGPIGPRSLPPYLHLAVQHPGTAAEPPVERTLEEVEVEHLRRVLTSTHGNRSAAARILGITRVGLLGKLKRFGIDIPPQSQGRPPA